MQGPNAETENKSMPIKASPRLTAGSVYNRAARHVLKNRNHVRKARTDGKQSRNGFYKIACHLMKTLFKSIFSQDACRCCRHH